MKRTWNLAPVLQIVQKIPENYCSCSHLSIGHVLRLIELLLKIYSKISSISCTNIYHDATDLVNQGMVKNTKAWISWERNITFLQNKKFCNLCLRWHILRSYHFVAEVNFNNSWFTFHYSSWCFHKFSNHILKKNIFQESHIVNKHKIMVLKPPNKHQINRQCHSSF